MDAGNFLQWAVAIVSLSIAAAILVRLFWRVRSQLRLWRTEDTPLHSATAVIWREPGRVEDLDLAAGPGGVDGAPAPPFAFLEEHFTGSRPCISVRDARGRTWRIKWGDEVRVETLATRLAWAAGYFAETTYFVPAGEIANTPALKRAASAVDERGRFADARFELVEDEVITHFDEHSWAWNDNPFVGTRELNGLKIVMMWLSNWDAKDVRDVALGSNTAIFEHRREDGRREARYLIIDWGGALGRWGNVVNRGRWDSAGFAAQTTSLVAGVENGLVRWGYTGQRTADIAEGIRVSDVRWLVSYLERLSERQIAAAVRASGGTADEESCFTRELLARVRAMRDAVSQRSCASNR